jgi:hypothetical protein
MSQVYIEPLPKGCWGPVDGYSLEFRDGYRITPQVYRSETLAISEIRLRGYVPLTARVRVTDKSDPAHWESA